MGKLGDCLLYTSKERRVYFDAKAKVHLKEYIEGRKDENKALFVTLDAPYDRLKISGVEIRLRQLGRKLDLEKIHPHKFRRTMATRAIDKGMPIEPVSYTHLKVSEIIALRKRELSSLDDLIKARFVEMFGDPATNPMRWSETTIGDECFYIKAFITNSCFAPSHRISCRITKHLDKSGFNEII